MILIQINRQRWFGRLTSLKMVKVTPISTISSRLDKKFPKVRNIHVKNASFLPKTKPKVENVGKDSWIVRCFKEFAANTALHGYNHIVRAETSKWERYIFSIFI